jgi:hypothetical protein
VKISNKKKKNFASETNTFHISYVESKNWKYTLALQYLLDNRRHRGLSHLNLRLSTVNSHIMQFQAGRTIEAGWVPLEKNQNLENIR